MPVQLRRHTSLAAISLTPLIDVVFLLLIFFLVASRISDEEPRLDLELPSVSEALPAMFSPTELVVQINRDGHYYLDGNRVQIEQLEQSLRQAQANNPTTQAVIIRADRAADWEAVALALNLCKRVGIHQYSAAMEDE
jgi:biopolymer transport protein ExbD